MYPYVEFQVKEQDSFEAFVAYMQKHGVEVSSYSKEVTTSLPQERIEKIRVAARMNISDEVARFTFEKQLLQNESCFLEFHADEYAQMSEINRNRLKELFPDGPLDASLEKKRDNSVKQSRMVNIFIKLLIVIPLILLFTLGFFAVVGIRHTFWGN